MASNKEIVALSDFEHVLARPSIYISSVIATEEKISIVRAGKIVQEVKEVSVGFYKLMNEILDNGFDEAKRHRNMKRVEIHFKSSDNSVTVVDTGGGFLNGSSINSKTGLTNVASAMSMLRAGSNFFNDDSGDHLIGTNGVGASVVNMLSDKFSVTTINSTEKYVQSWNKFIPTEPVITKNNGEQTGTIVTYVPRADTFKGCKWDKDYIHTMMIFRQFMKKIDPVISKLEFICTFDGIKLDLDVNFLPSEHFVIDTKHGTLYVWETYPQSTSISFVNSAMCSGIHQRIVSEWLNDSFESQLAGRFYEAMIVLNLPPKMVRFQDQNKTRFALTRGEITSHLEKAFLAGIKKNLKNSVIYDKIMKKIAESEKEGDLKNLKNKKKIQKQKISDKYFPPSVKTKHLYIVEGMSSMGSILQKRDPKSDAVYALKGKIKNARRLSDLSSNSEIIDLMNILNIDPENDKNCKYEKVIIATDADPDGLGHIASLIVNLFYKWFPNVILQGKLYILQTPLLSIDESKKIKYFYSMKDFSAFSKDKKLTNVRYLKGLGSLSMSDWSHVFADMRLLKLTHDTKTNSMMEMAFGNNAGLRKKWLQS